VAADVLGTDEVGDVKHAVGGVGVKSTVVARVKTAFTTLKGLLFFSGIFAGVSDLLTMFSA
jgi:hypothetical protein